MHANLRTISPEHALRACAYHNPRIVALVCFVCWSAGAAAEWSFGQEKPTTNAADTSVQSAVQTTDQALRSPSPLDASVVAQQFFGIASQTPSRSSIPTRLASHSDLAPATSSSIATPEVVAWLEKMIRANLPPRYEDDRKWDKQKEVWNGIELRREGLRIETKRKWKTVNAGTWTKYAISFVDPDQNLFIQFHRLETLPDGRIAFAVSVDCALDVFGRLSQWVRDVQVISISANADAACRLMLEGTVQFRMNPLKLPPDVSLKPHVDRADVELTYYRVRRISQVGGDFAKVLGNGLRHVVDEKIEDMNGKLADKINKQLDKHSDKLSFSAQDWLQAKLSVPDATE